LSFIVKVWLLDLGDLLHLLLFFFFILYQLVWLWFTRLLKTLIILSLISLFFGFFLLRWLLLCLNGFRFLIVNVSLECLYLTSEATNDIIGWLFLDLIFILLKFIINFTFTYLGNDLTFRILTTRLLDTITNIITATVVLHRL